MSDSDKLKQLYREILGKGPFPSKECALAQITGSAHGELILYLADIAGLAERGEKGLKSLSETERQNFQKLASKRNSNSPRTNHSGNDSKATCSNRGDGASKTPHLARARILVELIFAAPP